MCVASVVLRADEDLIAPVESGFDLFLKSGLELRPVCRLAILLSSCSSSVSRKKNASQPLSKQ
jgi:hypothetical protein